MKAKLIFCCIVFVLILSGKISAQCSFTLSTGKQDVACTGDSTGMAWVVVSGGSGNFTFQWNTSPVQNNDTAYNLPAGTYIVIVTDVNTSCSDTDSVMIAEPGNPLGYYTASKPVLCYGDSNGLGYVEVVGGTMPYTITWYTLTPVVVNDSAFNLWAGTYPVAIEDANGCKDTALVTVNSPTPLTLSGSSSPPLCTYTQDGWAAVFAAGGNPPYTYTWNTNPVQNNDTAYNLAPGNYTVVVSDTNNCTDSLTITVPVNNNPIVISFNPVVNNPCFGDSLGQATVNASGGQSPYNFVWDIYGNNVSGSFVDSLASGTYWVWVYDANGCVDSASVTISSPSPLNISVNSTPEACGDSSGTASANVSGGIPPYSYIWNTNPVQTSSTAVNLSAGWYTVTVTDNNGCSITDSVYVANNNGTIYVNANAQDISCFGFNDGMAWAQAGGGSGTYVYQWNTSPVQINDTAFNLPPGTYIVTVTDANNCQATDTVTINEPLPLDADTLVYNAICTAGNGMAIILPSGGTPPYSYTWYTVPMQYNDTATNLYPGIYNFQITDANGCQYSSSATVGNDVITLTGQIQIVNPVSCFGGNDGSLTVILNNGQPPYTYSWNTNPVQTNDTAFNLQAGSYNVTVTDQWGCTNQFSFNLGQPNAINLYTQIVNDFGGNCSGSAVVYPTGGIPPYSYNWTPGNFNTDSISNLCAGMYCVTVTDSKGCSKNTCVQILGSANCNLTVNATSTNVTCNGLNNGSVNATVTGNIGSYTLTWYDANNQPIGTTNNLPPGTYYVVVVDSVGCVDSALTSITEPSAITVDYAVNHVKCKYDHNGSAWVNAINGGTAPYTISWQPLNVNTTIVNNLSPGNYYLIVTDANNCKDTSLVVVNANSNFELFVSNKENTVCQFAQGKIELGYNGNNGTVVFHWNTGDTTQIIQNLAAGSYTVIAHDSLMCYDTLSTSILSIDNIEIEKIKVNETCRGYADGSVTVSPKKGQPPFEIIWQNGETDWMLTNIGNGIYSFLVKDARNCILRDTAAVYFERENCLNIPNVFTPNGDGDNDYWVIKGHENYPEMHITIFNRWGNVIFETDNYDVPWDGKYNGKPVPTGTYYYIIDLKNGNEKIKGDLTIIR